VFKARKDDEIYAQIMENEYHNKPVIDEFTKYGEVTYNYAMPEEQTAVFEDFFATVESTVENYLEVHGHKMGEPSRLMMENVLDNRILETYNFAKKIDKARRNMFNPALVQDTYKKLDRWEN